MRCIYDGIDLMPLQTHYFDYEPVYDPTGTDYLYTKVSMAVRAVVNGQSSVQPVSNGPFMNYTFDKQIPNPIDPGKLNLVTNSLPTTFPSEPTGNVANNAGISNAKLSQLRRIIRDPQSTNGGPNPTDVTHQAIRFRLSIPQRKLFIFWGAGYEIIGPPRGVPATGEAPPGIKGKTQSDEVSRLFIQSPGLDPTDKTGKTSLRCDCKNGPFPRILSVIQAEGDANTLIVDWAVETYINEASTNQVANAGILLSNRFSQTHDVDENGWTTMTTTGAVIVRTDFVQAIPLTPDIIRPQAFMPILSGFTREILYVRGREDGTGIEYSYKDTQVPVNFVAGPFCLGAKIAVLHRQAVTSHIDFYSSALSGYERTISLLANKKFAKGDKKTPEEEKAANRLTNALAALIRRASKGKK